MSYLLGSGLTRFGRHEGRSTLDLMSEAAAAALADAGLERGDVDGLICGYATTMPHIMLATVFAEHFGLTPSYAHAVQVGGATGFAMTMLAHLLVESGAARRVLVVGGENRMTGQSRDASIQALAQAGHPVYEVPLGPTIPAYYGRCGPATRCCIPERISAIRSPPPTCSRRAPSRRRSRCSTAVRCPMAAARW